MGCPLCNEDRSRESWLGTAIYHGKAFPYVECCRCFSLYCDPMPDEQTLREMYGPSYVMSFSPDPSIDDPKEPEKVLAWLAKSGKGTFIDYGCGKGELLNAAADLGWNVLGVEFDDEVALKLTQQTGLEVLTTRQALASEAIADVLHLGDVVEHMTKINKQMPEVLKLIKPGGYLIAQGPLEGNLNVFTLGIRLSRSLRSANIEMAPFHVMLATKKGQEECFRRFNLTQQEFSVTEVDWPAPSQLSSSDLLSPRLVGLFTLRRLSRLVSLVRPGWGNRYFYIGRQDG
jgi:SAM-dependent methyltransferase